MDTEAVLDFGYSQEFCDCQHTRHGKDQRRRKNVKQSEHGLPECLHNFEMALRNHFSGNSVIEKVPGIKGACVVYRLMIPEFAEISGLFGGR